MSDIRSRLWKAYRVLRKQYKRFNKNCRRDVRNLDKSRSRRAMQGIALACALTGTPTIKAGKRFKRRVVW